MYSALVSVPTHLDWLMLFRGGYWSLCLLGTLQMVMKQVPEFEELAESDF